MATCDPFFVGEAVEYREELKNEWEEVKEVFDKYPKLFTHTNSERVFFSFYAQVCSRCFGWGIPHTSMIPMADNLNHSDVSVLCEVVTKSLH